MNRITRLLLAIQTTAEQANEHDPDEASNCLDAIHELAQCALHPSLSPSPTALAYLPEADRDPLLYRR